MKSETGNRKIRDLGIIIILFGLFVVGRAYSEIWSETTFSSGAFNSTIPFDSNNSVIIQYSLDNGNGADGTGNTTGSNNLNTGSICGRGTADAVNFSTTGVINTGNATITLSSAPAGLAIGDEIVIINLKGTSADNTNVGNYETKRISNIAANTLTLDTPLTKDYGDSAIQKIMVQRVPNYTSVTVSLGHTLTCNAFDGAKGGVLYLRATGTITVTGTIDVSGKGYRGGSGGFSGTSAGGGETYNGSGGNGGTAVGGGINIVAPGTQLQGGGGGGGTDDGASAGGVAGTPGGGGGGGGGSDGSSSPTGGGGGGGGHATAGSAGTGGAGGATGTNPNGGLGGNGSGQAGGNGGGGGIYGIASLSKMYFGSAGAASGGRRNNTAGAVGANGGGVIYIAANNINVTGGIFAKGNNGTTNAGTTQSGSGAGGSIKLLARTLTLGVNLVVATGGTTYGTGGNGYIRVEYESAPSGTTNPVHSGSFLNIYLLSGNYVSPIISPDGLVSWGVLTYTRTTPANTIFTVDVLHGYNGTVLCSNVASGTDLANILPKYTPIKLRANFSTSEITQTPTLSDWNIGYIAGGIIVDTSNWTDLVNGQSVQMGQSIAHVKFEMKTIEGTARWKRFRIDKGVKAYTNIACPDNKIEVQVWCDANNNGLWDSGDTLISKGVFTNGTCRLNMNRWQVTTAPKTYYIVYKLSGDIGGGQRAGVKIADSSYLEFEDAVCVGVPP
ncbi:MAG: hypothetical protein HY811_06360 [Planctomycetes bacterium]|nr:hypothetical protein [Planctomycetota bacterium]